MSQELVEEQPPWLPRGFEFLAGLPEWKRRQRPIVTIHAYLDDSGAKNQGPSMVVAGMVGPAEVWAHVATEWDKELRSNTPHPIAYFKEYEAMHFSGEFSYWKREARDEKVERLLRIVDRPDLFACWFGVDIDGFNSVAKFTGKPLVDVKRHMGNEPYLLLTEAVLMEVAWQVSHYLVVQRLELFIDEQLVYKKDLQAGYPIMRRAMAAVDPRIDQILPEQLYFRDDREFLPLQAADLLAGYKRRAAVENTPTLPFKVTQLRESPGSTFMHGQRLIDWAQGFTRKKLVMVPDAPRPKPKGRQ